MNRFSLILFSLITLFISCFAPFKTEAAKQEIPADITQKLQEINSDNISTENIDKLTKEVFKWSRENGRTDVCARLLSRYGIYLCSLEFFDLSSDIFRCAAQFVDVEDERVFVFIQAGKAISDYHNGLRAEAEKTLISTEKRVAKMQESIPQQIMLLTIYNYLGEIYSGTGREQKAFENYDKALKLAMAVGDKNTACITISNMCKLNFYNKQVEELLQQAMQMAMEIENNEIIYSLIMAKAQLAYKRADYKNALVELEKAESYSRINSADDSMPIQWKAMTDYLELRSRCYANLDQSGRAYDTMIKYLDETESKSISKELLHNKHWVICHDLIALSDAYNSDIIDTAQGESWQRREYILLAIAIVLIILISGLCYYIARRQAGSNSALASKDKEIADTLASLQVVNKQLTEEKNSVRQLSGQVDEMKSKLSELKEENEIIARDATIYSLFFNARNEFLGKLRELIRDGYHLSPVEQQAHQKKLSASILLCLEKENKDDKDVIDIVYEKNSSFFEHLNQRCPSLTDNDKRMALYIHIGISTRNIARMTGQQVKTISVSRFRLRKALGYDSDAEMNRALMDM